MRRGSPRPSGSNAVFYKPVAGVEEIRTGYLIKSPPSGPFRSMRSWKRRFFVLFRMTTETHQLKYFRSAEDREKPLGGIDLTQISLLFANPQNHARWPWIQKTFKCSADCVLYIRAADRDYFLIGESSWEMDEWFYVLYEALKDRPHKSLSPEEMSDERPFSIECISDPILKVSSCIRPECSDAGKEHENVSDAKDRIKSYILPKCQPQIMKLRSISAPPTPVRPASFVEMGKTSACEVRRWSEPLEPHYDYPSNYLLSVAHQKGVDEEEPYEDDGHSYYVKMETVYDTVKEADQRDKDRLVQSVVTEVEECTGGAQGFEKVMTMPSLEEETSLVEREDLPSNCSSVSSENGGLSPVDIRCLTLRHQSSTDSSNDEVNPAERDIHLNQTDFKNLTVADMEGKPCVFGWTAQPQSPCLFHKGDQILAINDLHMTSVEEFHTYLSKLLKNHVKLTILRLPGSEPLDSASRCSCE